MKNMLYFESFSGFKKKHAQITTLFVLVLAIMLFFITVLVDLAEVSRTKTTADIAVDSGGLLLGSMISSRAKALSDQGADGRVRYTHEGCFWSGWLGQLLAWIGIIVATILSVVAGGAPLIIAMAIFSGTAGWAAGEMARKAAVMQGFNETLNMINNDEVRFQEQVILSVIGGMVDDPDQVKDVHDMLRSGRQDEWVGRFQHHYQKRVNDMAVEGMDSEAREAAKNIVNWIRSRLIRLRFLIYGTWGNGESENSLRFFLRDKVWEVFERMKDPGYDAEALQDVINCRDDGIIAWGNEGGYPYSYEVPYLLWEIWHQYDHGYGNHREVMRLAFDPEYYFNEYDVGAGKWHWIPDAGNSYWKDSRWNQLHTLGSDELGRVSSEISHIFYDIFHRADNSLSEVGRIDRLMYQSGPTNDKITELISSQQGLSLWAEQIWNHENRDDGSRRSGPVWCEDYGEWEYSLTANIYLWEKFIIGWRNIFNGLLNDLVGVWGPLRDDEWRRGWLYREIERAEDFKNELDPDDEYEARGINIFNRYINLLNEAKNALEELRDKADEAYVKLGEFLYGEGEEDDPDPDSCGHILGLQRLRNSLEWNAGRLYKPPHSEGERGMVYAWKDTRGWHLVQVEVENPEIPTIRSRERRKWNRAEVYVRIEPYNRARGEDGEKKWAGEPVQVVGRRFSQPRSSTPWWDFFFASRLDRENGRQEWENLKTNLESVIEESDFGAKIICDTNYLYGEINNFLERFGVESKVKSRVAWHDHRSNESRWRIDLISPE